MNKRGNIIDYFLIIAILFLVVVSLFVSVKILNVASMASVFDEAPEARGAVTSAQNTLLNFDNLLLFVIIGLSLFVLFTMTITVAVSEPPLPSFIVYVNVSAP